ncbi:hypothetical protein [Thiocystis violacea]|uniref:hypothetical protein n=1 Tax=Thiocystis violacea TaxID=13725 RepID=UPI0019087555|nr:hypothetical protein [Thiocystis violacea]
MTIPQPAKLVHVFRRFTTLGLIGFFGVVVLVQAYGYYAAFPEISAGAASTASVRHVQHAPHHRERRGAAAKPPDRSAACAASCRLGWSRIGRLEQRARRARCAAGAGDAVPH